MSKARVAPAKCGKADVRPQPNTKRERRIAGEKDYVVVLAPTKSRDGWVATIEKHGVPMDGVRVEASSYQVTLHAAFEALKQRTAPRSLPDNVAWRLKLSARKRSVIERVQPASNAAFSASVDAIVAYREFLHWSRRTVEVLRDEGLSDEDLARIALCHPRDVRAWLSSEREDDWWTEGHVAQWLSNHAREVIHYAQARIDAAERAGTKATAKKGGRS